MQVARNQSVKWSKVFLCTMSSPHIPGAMKTEHVCVFRLFQKSSCAMVLITRREGDLAVTGLLADANIAGNIEDASQFHDIESDSFHMCVFFADLASSSFIPLAHTLHTHTRARRHSLPCLLCLTCWPFP